MPTKRNKAGQQQPYVPQGNGDASGEYADNQSGSNKHFTNFKQPGEETTQKGFTTFSKAEEQPQTTKTNDEQEIKTVRRKARNSLIGKCVNSSRENDITFEEVVDDSNDEGVKILDDYLGSNDKLKIKFGNAGRNAAGCAWGYSDITTNHDTHTIRHELGHTFDNWYGKDLPENGRGNFDDKDYASVKFVDDETGKTMNEMLHEELGVSMYKATIKGWKIGYIKQGVDKREVKVAAAKRINDVLNKYADQIYDKITGIPNSRERYKELQIKYNEINSNMYKDMAETQEGIEYEKTKKEVYKAENDYRNEMIRKGAWSIYYDNSPEVKAARAKENVAYQKYQAKKNELFKQKFGEKELQEHELLSKEQYNVYKQIKGVASIVGDTFDYLDAGSSFYTTNGHGSNYFKQRKESGYCLEVFANMFDCYMSKDAWKKECVKELFPKTSKIFEKIYYKKGKK